MCMPFLALSGVTLDVLVRSSECQSRRSTLASELDSASKAFIRVFVATQGHSLLDILRKL